MELDSSKPNIRDEIDTPRGAIFNLSSVAQSLDGGNIRLSMLANYARSSSQARTHPVARMEATRLIIPSFLDELLRAQQRGRGEKKSSSIQANAWANVYRRWARGRGGGEGLGQTIRLIS